MPSKNIKTKYISSQDGETYMAKKGRNGYYELRVEKTFINIKQY